MAGAIGLETAALINLEIPALIHPKTTALINLETTALIHSSRAALIHPKTTALIHPETTVLLRLDEQDFKRAYPRTWYYGKEIESAEKAASEARTPKPAGADLGHDENRYASLTQRETSQLAAERY